MEQTIRHRIRRPGSRWRSLRTSLLRRPFRGCRTPGAGRRWLWRYLQLLMVVIAHWRKRWVANRYRREALESLMRLENDLGNDAMRPSALLAIPELLKRVALAAWPRETVASLSGASWLTFLRRHGGEKSFPDPISRILDDLEYRSTQAIANISEGDARRFAQSARQWIEDHVVSA